MATFISSARLVRSAMERTLPDLLIVDFRLAPEEEFAAIKNLRLQEEYRLIPIVAIAAAAEARALHDAIQPPGDTILTWPLTKERLRTHVERCLSSAVRKEISAEILQFQGLTLRIAEHSVEIDGVPVTLSRREFELLSAFLEKPGRVMNRRFLLERAWGGGAELRMNSKTVDVAVGRLRARLGRWGRLIEAVPHYGYRLAVLP